MTNEAVADFFGTALPPTRQARTAALICARKPMGVSGWTAAARLAPNTLEPGGSEVAGGWLETRRQLRFLHALHYFFFSFCLGEKSRLEVRVGDQAPVR